MNSFTIKKLSYRFIQRDKKQFIAKIDSSYPSTLSIEYAGLPSLNQASIKIFNIRPDVMNLLSFLSYKSLDLSNLVVECLVDEKTVFKGDIVESIPMYDIPNPYLQVKAMTDIIYLVQPSKDIIFDIPDNNDFIDIPIKDIINTIFSDTNKNISYKNVDSVRVTNPRYLGSKIQQLEKIKLEADINIVVNYDSVNVFSKDSSSSNTILNIDGGGNEIVKQISNDKEGIILNTIFNNNFELGKQIRITDNKINPQANGNFYIYELRHDLSCNIPNGNFFTNIKARYLGGNNDKRI